MNTNKKSSNDRDKKLFYAAIKEVLINKFQENSVPSYEYLIKSSMKVQFNKAYKFIIEYKAQVFSSLNKIETQRLVMLCTRLVIDMLEEVNAPVSIKTVLNNFEKIPALIDRAYPDYIKNNLLYLLFR